jgi:hypothetical protein
MSQDSAVAWWDRVPTHVDGDMIVGQVGPGARGVAIGKNITQAVYEVLGEPQPDDKEIIQQHFAKTFSALDQARDQLQGPAATMADFQVKLLQGELTKTEPADMPSASTITQVGDWLLDNVPQIAEALTSLFATPAVGKIVGKAGEVAVTWVRDRFGGSGATA